jgi:DNA-binding GntR family transcriptional regulator
MAASEKASAFARSSDSLSEDAYEWIVKAITSFAIPTNSQLSENKLAAQLGISRTPVREALRRLETEGLVQRGEAGRFTVAMLTEKEVHDACDFLIICDTYIFSKASERIDKDQSDLIKKATKEMIAAGKAGDKSAWTKSDSVFHETVMTAADNPIISEAARMTRRRIQRFWARSPQSTDNLFSCSQEHVDLANAIVDKDIKAISKGVNEHITHLRSNMLEIVRAAAPFLGQF